MTKGCDAENDTKPKSEQRSRLVDAFCKTLAPEHREAARETLLAFLAASRPKYLTRVEAAAVVHHSVPGLDAKRYAGTGPAYIKAGKKVLYREQDLFAWLLSQRIEPFTFPDGQGQ